MTNSSISVVIPVRAMRGKLANLETTLRMCTGLPIDILLIHDDANDGTSLELRQLVAEINNEKILLVEKNLNSPGLARNIGISFARAKWICFWDSDDLPSPVAYLEMVKVAISKNAQVCIGAICSMDIDSGKIETTYALDNSREDWLFELVNMPGFTRMVFERDVIGNVRFKDFRIGEDQCFLRDINFLNYKIYTTSKTCYTYITNFEGQLTRNDFALADLRRTVDYLVIKFFEAEGDMATFSQGQVIKLFLSALRLPGRANWLRQSPGTFLRIFVMCLLHPWRINRIVSFLAKNRVKLAGR